MPVRSQQKQEFVVQAHRRTGATVAAPELTVFNPQGLTRWASITNTPLARSRYMRLEHHRRICFPIL